MAGELPYAGLPKSALDSLKARRVTELSSSENSVSMEASNSEEEQPDSSAQSHKTPSETSDGPSPCKQPRKHVKRHVEESSEGE